MKASKLREITFKTTKESLRKILAKIEFSGQEESIGWSDILIATKQGRGIRVNKRLLTNIQIHCLESLGYTVENHKHLEDIFINWS